MKGFVAAVVAVLALGAAAVATVALQGGAPDVRVAPAAARAPEPPAALPAPPAAAEPAAAPGPPPAPPVAAPAPAPAPVAHDPADRRLESQDEGERQEGMTAVRDQRRAKVIEWMNRRRQRR